MLTLMFLAVPIWSVSAQEAGDSVIASRTVEHAASLKRADSDASVVYDRKLSERAERPYPSAVISTEEAERGLSRSTAARPPASYGDPYRFWKWPARDAMAILNGVTSRRTLLVAGGGAILMLAARYDGEITAELTDIHPEPAELLVRVVEEFGNVRAVRPFAGVVFLGSLMTDNRRFQDAAFTSFEAIIMANLMTSALKTVFGRARPWQNEGDMVFKPFSGNTGFPSGHATTAFAFVTPWLLYYPNAFTPGLLVVGAGTAFTRMLTDNHWFTDIVAGSAIGFATAYVLTERHKTDGLRVVIAPSISLENPGVTISVRMP